MQKGSVKGHCDVKTYHSGVNNVWIMRNSAGLLSPYSPPQRLVLQIQAVVILKCEPLPDATPNMATIREYVVSERKLVLLV